MSHNSGVKLKVPSYMLTLRCFVDIELVMSGRVLTTVQRLGRDLN